MARHPDLSQCASNPLTQTVDQYSYSLSTDLSYFGIGLLQLLLFRFSASG
ncbi:hypothetical protein [Motiliproteus sp. MSK22-1]|nr:hypothetical protein [Motiliproteus sp. MSK22-1]